MLIDDTLFEVDFLVNLLNILLKTVSNRYLICKMCQNLDVHRLFSYATTETDYRFKIFKMSGSKDGSHPRFTFRIIQTFNTSFYRQTSRMKVSPHLIGPYNNDYYMNLYWYV